MVCKEYYFRVVARVVFLLLNSLILFYFIFHIPNVSLVVITASVLVYQVFALITYLNKVNTKIENIFMAHLSGEVTSSYSKSGRGGEFNKIYDYFNQMNSRLERIRIDNEIQNNYFKTIVDQTSVGLISFTGDGQVEFLNDATRRIFKVFVVKNLSKLNIFKEDFSDYLLHLEPEKTELVSVMVKGEMIQLSVKKVEFKAGTRSLNLVSVQNIKEELDQKEVESWQKLIRVLTHEIMNSITPITSVVNTLSRMFKNKDSGVVITPGEINVQSIERTVRGLDIVEKRGEGLKQFVSNYRDLTRLPKPEFQEVMVKQLFMDIEVLLQEDIAQRGIGLVIACHPSLQLLMDLKLIEQVMINLVKNAMEACDGNPQGLIKLSAYSSNEHTFIEVEDNGKGIPAEVAENMFVPFFTTKEKGSGIGLSLSRQFVRLHGGTLDFRSVPGEKTVFTIKL